MENSHRSQLTRTLRLVAGLMILVSLVLLARPPAVGALDYIVTTTADSGAGSLRAAIEAANSSEGHDTITFNIPEDQPGCSAANDCTITLSSATLVISDDLTIDGEGADITISGNGEGRVMEISVAETVTLNRLIITDGDTGSDHGAGVWVAGTLLELTNMTFYENISGAGGGALYALDATVNITDSTFNYNQSYTTNGGGAIYNQYGQLNVVNSSFAGNTSNNFGGAIYNEGGQLTVTGSTFLGVNFALADGGAIASVPLEDIAIGTYYPNVTITSSTFEKNMADSFASTNKGGAIYQRTGVLEVSNSTFHQNVTDDHGGAIYVEGAEVTVTNSDFTDNLAVQDGGAIYSTFLGEEPDRVYPDVTITNSTFTENEASSLAGENRGGAIYQQTGTLNVTTGEFIENTSDSYGGALYLEGAEADVVDSTFGFNSSRFGGAIYSTAEDLEITMSGSAFIKNDASTGGALYLGYGTVNVSNSTFSANESDNNGGAIYNSSATATVTHSTFFGNIAGDQGSSVYFSNVTSGSVNVRNSVLADDSDATNCYNASNGGGNLSDDDTCADATTSPLTLEPLADNGGPTPTHALPSGSPAIGAIDANIPETDQRGVARPTENADAGAYQTAVCGGSPYDVSSDAELTEAIHCINASTGDQQINVTQSFNVYQGTPQLNGTGGTVTIDGQGFTLTGDRKGRFFTLQGGTVEIENITLTGGRADNGGAINASAGTLTITNSTFSDNTADNFAGGALYTFEMTKTKVLDSTFTGNWADGYGGAILNDFGPMEVTNSMFNENEANTTNSGSRGGAIYNFADALLTVTNSTFSGNKAWNGGAIGTQSTVVVSNSTFYGNGGGAYGAILATDNTVTATNNLFVQNGDEPCVNSDVDATNLSDTACDDAVLTNLAPEDILDTTLAANGGTTYTHALVEGSPAIDHVASGNPAPATDQRGVSRPQGPRVDAGAFELEQEPVTDPCPPVDGNVIANFCFEDGSAPWTFHSDGHGVYNVSPFEPFAGNGAAEIKITVPGSNVQFYQSGIALQGDTEYELTFAAKSKDGRDLSVFVHKHGANYASYGLSNHVFNLTDEWAEYTVTFKTPVFSGGSVNDARLRFWLAPFDAAGAVYAIDRVVLRPAGGDPLPEPPPPPDPEVPPQGECDPTPGNLIANPGYEDGTFGWLFFTNGSANFTAPEEPAADPYECDANARVKINTSGNNVQLFQTGIELQPNTHYRLRLAAKATGANAVQLFVQRHSAPHSNYGLNGLKLDLTEEWQVFVVDFTTSGFASTTTDTRLRFWLAPYDTAGAVFEFDDVVLTPVVASPFRATDGAAERATTADAYLVSGYFIDNNHTDRLGGGYVGVLDGCRNARASVSRLWPANNKLWPVSIGNIGTPQSVAITGVWQDEPVGFEPDAVIGTGGALHLRAERDLDAGADGRVYTIQFRATYANGQSCNGIVTVGVPLSNRRGVEARSGGELFTSTDK